METQDLIHSSPASAPERFGDDFALTLWTDNPVLAARADMAGVDRIGLDLEVLGKAERQPGGLSTWISQHCEEALPSLRQVLRKARLFCRINPINPGSRDQIERLLAAGVEVLMLPMFTSRAEVEAFVAHVDGRARCVLLLENATAATAIDDILRAPGIDEVHVGLNDLTLSLGRPGANRFHVLGGDLMVRLSEAVRGAGLRFGVGGIGRAMDNDQPIPSDLIYAQYPRLGAASALIARSFFAPSGQIQMASDLRRARDRLTWWAAQPAEALEAARQQLLARTGAARW